MSTPTVPADPIKAKHRAMWAFGDYDRVATDLVTQLGRRLVDAAAITAGERVLDVAAGSGNASLPAAERRAVVTASDLTPELIEIGRQRAASQGLAITWQEADAEHLPFADNSYDVAMSCVGIMFAPFHQPVADELARVIAPGGRVALINWTPSGFIGQLFAAMKPFVPAPPPGATPPPKWGEEQYVRDLFGDRVTDVRAEVEDLAVDRFASGEQFRHYFADFYGPTIAAYRNVADDPGRTAELDAVIDGLADEWGAGTGHMKWQYLVFTARIV